MNHRSIMLALIALAPGLAHAQTAYSVDAEFVRPTYGNDSLAGVDVATARKPLTFRFGSALMYTREPVTLWDHLADKELGAVVTDRFSLMLGASFDISNRFTINALIPAAFNAGGDPGDASDFQAPGFGMQDIGVGARITAIRSKHFNLGVRGGLIFPSGRAKAYLGDEGFRPHGGLLASVHTGRTMFAGDFGIVGRPSVLKTQEDFTAGSELNFNVGIRHKLPAATRLGVSAQFLSKFGLNEGLFKGGGENALEALGGVEIYPSRHVVLDFSAGRGLTEGYATTDFRFIAGLKVEIVPKEAVTVVPPPPTIPRPPDPPPIIEDAPPPPVEENDFVVVTEDVIEIKQRLEFLVNTTNLLESSRPVLNAVADYLNGDWRVEHVEIVGHASEEGSYEYNYNLSQGRARTIWQELIKAGVHPNRISYKGMGEVVPRDTSKITRELTEEELQDNRRVEFNIVKKYDKLEEKPFDGYQTTVKAPWSGQVIRVIVPERPPPEPDENTLDDTDEFEEPFTLDELDEGFEEDAGTEEGAGDTGGGQ